MTRFHVLRVLSWLIAILILPTTLLASHPFHASSAEVEWNPKTGNFEISLCVWPADLEKAIGRQRNRAVDLDHIEDLDEILAKYLASRFSIVPAKSANHPTPNEIRWVGHEIDLRQAWLYFELPGDRQLDEWKIENRVFFELNADQVNQVQVKSGGPPESVSLSRGKLAFEFVTKRGSPKLRAGLNPASARKNE
jgi:hypothetical protein